MFDLTDFVDDQTAIIAILLVDTLSMMVAFMLALSSLYEIVGGGSYWNITWYIIFVAIARWYSARVREDWGAI